MTEEEIALLRAGRINLAFFLRAALPSGTLRLYAGANDFPLDADAVETDGGLYEAAGRWGGALPEVDQLMDGQAQGLTLSLSAVDLTTARLFLQDRHEVVGAPAAFGWAVLDERYRLGGAVRWPLRGVLSQPRLQRQKAGPETTTRILSATLISGAWLRRRGEHAYFSKADQRRAYPTDGSCDRVGLYAGETTRPWPR